MDILNVMRNYLSSLAGTGQEFEQLLAARDITAVKGKMTHRRGMIDRAREEYDCERHKVMRREDRLVEKRDKNGNVVDRHTVKTWKLPVPYQRYINEVSVVFLYGRAVKWSQTSEGTDNAFAKFLEVMERTHFNAKIRQCKRLAGAETESALLFRTFRNSEGKADVQLRVLAASKGDEIYCRWDQYENLMSAGWGYYLTETEDKVVYHFDVFTPERTYRCVQRAMGWEVTEEENLIGKIPLIVFQQETEWSAVQGLIEREEDIASRNADTNDYYSDPTMVVSADVIRSLPEKGEAGKVMVTNDAEGVDKAARYLTWDSAPESKKQELEWLQDQILNKSFTPKITLDSLKSVSQLSAKALRTVMMLAEIKADRHKETHDELLTRTANLFKAVIGNVLDVSLRGECSRLTVSHEWQEPFGDDSAESLEQIIKAVDAGIMSAETAVEMNPLVKNAIAEQERLTQEKEAAAALQRDIFAASEPAQGSSEDGASE